MLEAAGGVGQARHLVAAQHHWRIAGTAHAHQLARQIGPIEGIGEEEPQRRGHAVHGGHRNAGFTLGQLKLADIRGGRGMFISSISFCRSGLTRVLGSGVVIVRLLG